MHCLVMYIYIYSNFEDSTPTSMCMIDLAMSELYCTKKFCYTGLKSKNVYSQSVN